MSERVETLNKLCEVDRDFADIIFIETEVYKVCSRALNKYNNEM